VHLQIQAPPPPVNEVAVRRNSLQGDETKVFDLNPGEITPVFDLPASFAIYQLDFQGTITLPIDSVRGDIERALHRDSVQNQIGKIGNRVNTEFNLQYLELPSQPDVFGSTAIDSYYPAAVPTRSDPPEGPVRPEAHSLNS
jgi:hypothetical protein